jgi:hypothetical protein
MKPILASLALLAICGQAGAACRGGRCAVARVRAPVVVNTVAVAPVVAVTPVAVAVQKVLVLDPLFVAGYQGVNTYGAAVVPGAVTTPPATAPVPAKEPVAPPAKDDPSKLSDEQLLTALEKIGTSLGDLKKGQADATRAIEGVKADVANVQAWQKKAGARLDSLEKGKPIVPPMPPASK